jgi:aldose sugar dehydrogenase
MSEHAPSSIDRTGITMKSSLILSGVAVALVGIASVRPGGQRPSAFEDFTATVITGSLDTPWDMEWGPDSIIWVSERSGRISRVDPRTGARTTAGTVADVYESGEGGLMGIALHPDFARQPFLYAMHTYSTRGTTRNKLVRMRWNGSVLGPSETLFEGIQGGGIHNGSRIAVGRDGFLYITAGDGGWSDIAQDSNSLGGKIFRLTLAGRPAPGNPFGNATWSFGHRNPQGLVFHPTTGVLYQTEHGPSDNDEVNIIVAGGNYGWPKVHGLCDDDEREFCRAHHVIEPLTAWTPTVAIAGADLYLSDRIPSFRNSLLAASLSGSLWRMTLSSDGKRITARDQLIEGRYGRLRDVLVAANGDVYICTSNRDGRGSPREGDDRIIRLSAK